MHPSEVNLTPTFSKAMRIAIRFARMGLVDFDFKLGDGTLADAA